MVKRETSAFIGIDQGSSATKAVVVRGTGEMLGESNWAITVSGDRRETFELDAAELFASISEAFRWGTQVSKEAGCEVRAAGLAVQRSGVVAWQGERPVSPVLSWRDARLASRVDRLVDSPQTARWVLSRTGLSPIPFFAAPKIAYLQELFPDALYKVGTVDSWCLSRLLGNGSLVTDDSMASRTLAYDIHERDWSEQLCGFWGIARERLPRIKPSVGYWGSLQNGIPLFTSIGDKEAAAMRSLCFLSEGHFRARSRAALDLGTIATLTVCEETGPVPEEGVGCGVLCSIGSVAPTVESGSRDRHYVFQRELRSSIVGDVFDWLREVGLPSMSMEELSTLFRAVPDHDGVIFFAPRTASFGAASKQGGSPIQKDLIHEPAFLVRAALEHLAFSISHMIEEGRRRGSIGGAQEIVVSGRLAEIAGFCEIIAALSSSSLVVLADSGSGSSLGAAWLSAVGWSLWQGCADRDEWCGWSEAGTRFEPLHDARYATVRARYVRWLALRDGVG